MKIINGDLLTVNSGIILHQVNCMGATGGLAGALNRKWPQAFKSYRHACDSLTPQLGNVVLGIAAYSDVERELWKLLVAHVFGQYMPGANTDLDAVDRSLAKLSNQMKRIEYKDAPVYAPYKMGCGLGGGNWPDYEKILVKYFPDILIVNNER